MKQPTFHGRVLLPLSVFAEARVGDPLAMERILRYYDGYMNKLCTAMTAVVSIAAIRFSLIANQSFLSFYHSSLLKCPLNRLPPRASCCMGREIQNNHRRTRRAPPD